MIQCRVIQDMIRRQAKHILDVGHDFRCLSVVEGEDAIQDCDLVVSERFFAFSVELEERFEFGFLESAREWGMSQTRDGAS